MGILSKEQLKEMIQHYDIKIYYEEILESESDEKI